MKCALRCLPSAAAVSASSRTANSAGRCPVTPTYAFINAWNVYVYATAFITDKAKYTLPLALNVFQGEYGTDYGKLAAGCVIALIPVVVIFAFIQKHLSGGATSGAVKG